MHRRDSGALTGVQRGERGGAGEVAGGGAGGAAGAEEVVVEGVGGVALEVGRIVAGAALLDGGAVGAAAVGAARPVDGALQRAVLGVVLGHAPQLTPAAHPDRRPRGGRARGEEQEDGGEDQEAERGGRRHWVRQGGGDSGRIGGGFKSYPLRDRGRQHRSGWRGVFSTVFGVESGFPVEPGMRCGSFFKTLFFPGVFPLF